MLRRFPPPYLLSYLYQHETLPATSSDFQLWPHFVFVFNQEVKLSTCFCKRAFLHCSHFLRIATQKCPAKKKMEVEVAKGERHNKKSTTRNVRERRKNKKKTPPKTSLDLCSQLCAFHIVLQLNKMLDSMGRALGLSTKENVTFSCCRTRNVKAMVDAS